MSKIIRAAAIQIAPVLYSRESTVEKVVRKILDLGNKGVQFATFPETVVPYYPYFSFVEAPFAMGAEHYKLLDQAVVVPSNTTAAIGDAARKANMVVSIGVNERDGGTLYNTQLLFDADGTLVQRRRKLSPTYHERMVWGMGDGSGLRAIDTAVGRVGQLACWEHYNPLARYALMADGEEIHSAMYPGSFAGDIFSEQISVNIRQHALEAGAFVVNATAWLSLEQQQQILQDTNTTDLGPNLQRLFHCHCFARRRVPGRAATARRRGRDHCGLGLLADRQTQAHDGFARPLQPTRRACPGHRPHVEDTCLRATPSRN